VIARSHAEQFAAIMSADVLNKNLIGKKQTFFDREIDLLFREEKKKILTI